MKNIYKFSGGNISSGVGVEASPSLKFDVVKVRGREEDRENLSDTEVITITENCHEDAVVEEIMRFVFCRCFSLLTCSSCFFSGENSKVKTLEIVRIAV